MEDGWLDGEEQEEWIEAIDPEGEDLGFLLRREVSKLDLPIVTIETPERYLNDPYVSYHARMGHERGLFTDGRDLNDVQVVLLAGRMIKRRESEAKDRERVFEERFFTGNPEGYAAYREDKERKEQNEGNVADVEQRVPRSVEEFLSTLEAFSEGEDSDSDKGQEKAEGWLSSFLSDSDLDQMNDE